MCGRNWFGGATNENLPLTELRLNDIKSMFPKSFISQLKQIYICGNYGDAIMARDTLEILKYFREVNPTIALGLHTNGSGRTSDWWRQLGALLQQEHDYCRFSIDGLENTNHLYRRQTNWSTIMNSVTNFIDGSGRAIWEFIPFAHNVHQVTQARSLAKELGFEAFQVIKTGRFINEDKKQAHLHASFPVYNKDMSLDYVIYPADETRPSHQKNLSIKKVKYGKKLSLSGKKVSGLRPWTIKKSIWGKPKLKKEHYFDNHIITCKAKRDKSIYVNPQGLVTPCCWTGYIYADRKNAYLDQMRGLLHDVGLDAINCRKKPLKDIVESDWIQSIFPEGWEEKDPLKGKKLICAKYCGECNSSVSGEYEIAADTLQ